MDQADSEQSEPPGKCTQLKSNTPEHLWNDWKWQLSNTINDFTSLRQLINNLTEDVNSNLPLRITPYYLSLLSDDQNDPLRKTVIPSSLEQQISCGEALDPLNEHKQEVVPGLIHRYPDRVLLLTTDVCASYCRYCTRSRLVGQSEGYGFSRDRINKCLEYIQNHKEVRDVLLSGGDPLTLSDYSLEWLLQQIKNISHVEMIRIGTKVPVVLPQRITDDLCDMLKKYHPVWMSIHFTHPNEITPESSAACEKLANSGVPLGSQTVLLKGVNDNVDTLKSLMLKLLKIRVKPYYLYQCDPILGSAHFRTTIDTGINMIKGLRGYITGYGVPTFVVDLPGGGGKTPVSPNYLTKNDEGKMEFTNYTGELFKYAV